MQRPQRRTGYGYFETFSRASTSSSSSVSSAKEISRRFETILARETGDSVGGRLGACNERGIEPRGLTSLLRLGAGPAGRPLRSPDGHPLLDDLPRQRTTALVVRHGQHGARMTLGELTALDHLDHVLGKLEQPHPIRHRRLRPADTLGELAQRQPELVEHNRERTRLFDRRKIFARNVLDETEQQRVAVVGLAHDRGHGLQLGVARRAPATLAGDQLVAAGRARTHEHRLHDALRAHRVGQPRAGFRVEPPSRLPRVRMDRVDGKLGELRRSRSTEENFQAPAEASAFRHARQAPSPPSSRRPPRASGGRTRLRANRGSAPPRDARSAEPSA